MVNRSDCLQIGGGGVQLIRGRIQEYVVSCRMITHHFNHHFKSKATTILDFSKLVLTSNYFKFLGQYIYKSEIR